MKDNALPIEELRRVIDAFVEKVVIDPMIGFFFQSIAVDVLKQREFELAATWMGYPVKYSGRPLKAAHSQHPINGGHFDRRRTILKETLESFDVHPTLLSDWLSHTDALRSQITGDGKGICKSQETRLDALNRDDGPLALIRREKDKEE